MRIDDTQLEGIIADQIRQKGLNGMFDPSVMGSIKEKVKAEYRKTLAPPVEQLIPEGDANPPMPAVHNSFPYEDETEEQQQAVSPDATIPMEPVKEPGSEPTDQAYPPKVYTPELPDILKHVEPKKIVVVELNDIVENGENLSMKPFRLMDDIDNRKSMNDLWIGEGGTKAEVYIMKFEKAGEMVFDHARGTTTFTPLSVGVPAEEMGGSSFHENPYKAENPIGPAETTAPTPTQHEVETFVKTSVNVEDIVKKVTMDLMAKAYEERMKDDSRENMGMGAAQPEMTDIIPQPVYEAFQLGGKVNGVDFLSNDKGISRYRYNNKEYAIYDSVMFGKNKT